MKYLLLVAILITGCTHKSTPKFTIGEHITVKKGFYKGCTGFVTSFDDYFDYYTVISVVCPNGVEFPAKCFDMVDVE